MSEIIFIGSKRSGFEVLKKIYSLCADKILKVITFDDRVDIRSCFDDYCSFVKERGLELLIINPMGLDFALKEFSGKKVFLVGWYYLIPEPLLEKNDFYAIHYSYLPKYRGNAPVVWQIINGEKNIGVTLFKISTGMDDGDYIVRESFTLEEGDDVLSALLKADDLAVDIIDRYLQCILDGSVKLCPQNNEEATYCSLRTPDDGRIDWQWSVENIINFIRAQSYPYPGAYTIDSSGNKIYITKAVVDCREIYAPIGAVFERSREGITIKCGDGSIKILEANAGREKDLLKLFKSLKTRL
ncbi:methionyl-tRNA formyltransferase [Motiliproteus sp. SC1-56]|uniref:methionyl-tRNA formyltransferase n=1 Tax=Motiliproteus sp. SC1-56 TaxID=2799565 RepID=UPI001A8F2857|nr:formyltransferase family protein [Motiliproteus sp. SC1-56]